MIKLPEKIKAPCCFNIDRTAPRSCGCAELYLDEMIDTHRIVPCYRRISNDEVYLSFKNKKDILDWISDKKNLVTII